MADDDEPGSGSSLLWYEVGRSSGYRWGRNRGQREGEDHGYRQGYDHGFNAGFNDAVRQMDARTRAEEQAGLRTIHLKEYNKLVDLANDRGRRIAELEAEIQSLESSLKIVREDRDSYSCKLNRTDEFNAGYYSCLWALVKAGENGKTGCPEYAELKALVYRMYDEWLKGEIICHPRAMGPRIADLRQFLSR